MQAEMASMFGLGSTLRPHGRAGCSRPRNGPRSGCSGSSWWCFPSRGRSPSKNLRQYNCQIPSSIRSKCGRRGIVFLERQRRPINRRAVNYGYTSRGFWFLENARSHFSWTHSDGLQIKLNLTETFHHNYIFERLRQSRLRRFLYEFQRS